ncbi:MAG: SCO family protein [Mucilaginibacter sp.]
MKKLLGAAAILLLYSACNLTGSKKTLPIYGEREVAAKNVNGQTVVDTIYHTIPAFKFINQYGDSITNKSLNGDIYVADFFFTSCPSICPVMHRNMLSVYKQFKDATDVKIISYSIDPKHDSVNVLKNYATKLDITGNTWYFLQGKKEDTYKLSESYLVTKPQEDAKQMFIHDGYFILVDKQQRIRGTYDGTKPQEVENLIADIKTLRTEADQNPTK